VEWIFVNSNRHRILETRIADDKSPFSEALNTHLGNVELSVYKSVPIHEWCLFFKHEGCAANSPLYYKFATSDTLRGALKNKTVIEFPAFFVVLPSEACHYPLVPLTESKDNPMVLHEATMAALPKVEQKGKMDDKESTVIDVPSASMVIQTESNSVSPEENLIKVVKRKEETSIEGLNPPKRQRTEDKEH